MPGRHRQRGDRRQQRDGPGHRTSTVPVDQTPSLNITKTADVVSVDVAGEVISYTITVQNTGNTTLTGVTVTDDLATTAPSLVSGDTDLDNALEVGETWTYTATYTVTQAEIDAGADLVNVATADSTESLRTPTTRRSRSTQTPSLNIIKTADVVSVDVAGDVISYTITVQNTGNTTLTGVTVTDDLATTAPTLVSGDTDGQPARCWRDVDVHGDVHRDAGRH